MAAGSGKTIVMAMLIAWQVPNKAANAQQDARFSKNIFVVARGLTVRDRLRVKWVKEDLKRKAQPHETPPT